MKLLFYFLLHIVLFHNTCTSLTVYSLLIHVHDELVFEVPSEQAMGLACNMRHILQQNSLLHSFIGPLKVQSEDIGFFMYFISLCIICRCLLQLELV